MTLIVAVIVGASMAFSVAAAFRVLAREPVRTPRPGSRLRPR